METLVLPEAGVNVMITFEKEFRTGPYGLEKYTTVVTKKGWFNPPDVGFYGYYNSKNEFIKPPNGYFSVPPRWADFKGVNLPDGWGGDRPTPEQIIKWEYCKKDESKN